MIFPFITQPLFLFFTNRLFSTDNIKSDLLYFMIPVYCIIFYIKWDLTKHSLHWTKSHIIIRTWPSKIRSKKNHLIIVHCICAILYFFNFSHEVSEVLLKLHSSCLLTSHSWAMFSCPTAGYQCTQRFPLPSSSHDS